MTQASISYFLSYLFQLEIIDACVNYIHALRKQLFPRENRNRFCSQNCPQNEDEDTVESRSDVNSASNDPNNNNGEEDDIDEIVGLSDNELEDDDVEDEDDKENSFES